MLRYLLLGCLLLALAAPSVGQSVGIGDLECLPLEENAALAADIGADQAGSRVRLFFRRLNPVGGFYSVEMHPAGAGSYWTVFPKPEQREQSELTDEWWELLEDRDWMQGHDRDWLESWLEEQEHEAAEYYVATYDAAGQVSARSETRLVEVRGDPERGGDDDEGENEDCAVPPLDLKQSGWAQNLTVGETTGDQAGQPVFHWLCDGIVTRINQQGVYRADEYCRACVVGVGFVPVAAIAAGVVSGAIIEHPEASPRQP
ncbi:MAG: hypothetical protein ACRD0X_05390 [Thermoanaerobaculia bacterium]